MIIFCSNYRFVAYVGSIKKISTPLFYRAISRDELYAGNRTIKKTPDVYTIAAGARLGMQVTPALGFFVGADYGYTLGEDKDLIEELEISPVSASLGARISF